MMKWSWLRKLLGLKPLPPPPPRYVEVGKAIVTIETANREYMIEMRGSYDGKDPWGGRLDMITTANERFCDWRENCGNVAMWSVGAGEHIPQHLITKISVRYEKHQVKG